MIITGAVYIILFIICMLMNIDNPTAQNDVTEFLQVWYPILLILGGSLFTSSLFSELNNQQSGQIFLTLPASNLEKYASKWLMSTIGIVLWITITFWLFQLILGFVTSTFYGYGLDTLSVFGEPYGIGMYGESFSVNWVIIQIYIATSSIYFLGAIAFRKYEFFKTVLATFLFNLVIALISAGVFYLVMYDFLPQNNNHFHSVHVEMGEGFRHFAADYGLQILIFIGQFVIPIILWTAAYFKLKEAEV